MNTPVLWSGGRLVDAADASVHWSDHGLTVGDGVFETIELRRGQPFALSRHLRRLGTSAAGLGLAPVDDAAVRSAVDAVASSWGPAPGRLRITYTAGPGPMGSDRGGATPTLMISATPMIVQTQPTAAITVPYCRNERGALTGLKTTSYAENVVALNEAIAAGASEALFANTIGNLCEGTGSNVFVAVDDRLVTPPLSAGCLAGITRELVLEALDREGVPAAQEDVAMDRVASVDEMFLVSTGRHVQPVTVLDGAAVGDGRSAGPLTARAAEIWRAAFDHLVDP